MSDAVYLVSRFMNTIKKEKNFEKYKSIRGKDWDKFVVGCDTYEEAKRYLVNRAELRIINLKEEIKKLERTIPKLRAMTESASSTEDGKTLTP